MYYVIPSIHIFKHTNLNINKTKYFRLWQYDEVWFLSESLLSAFEYLINAYMDSNEEVLEEYQKQWDSMSLF